MNDKVKVNKWMYSTIFLSICVLVLAGFLYKDKITSKLTMGNQISNETQLEVIPTELEVREKVPEAVKYSSHLVNYLGGDIDSEKIVADYFPILWQTGVLIVHFYDSKSWPNEAVPRMASFLMVKSQGGIIYSAWGASGGILHFKDYTEIASFVNVASNGSTLYLPIWRGTNLWSREEIWDRNYLLNEDNIIKLQKENK